MYYNLDALQYALKVVKETYFVWSAYNQPPKMMCFQNCLSVLALNKSFKFWVLVQISCVKAHACLAWSSYDTK